jgi:hypothetical protein
MTSTYHRRYFPDDLDGTVADVAPLSFSMDDERYVTFVDQVGGEELAACRAKLAAFQQTLLDRRDIFMSRVEGEFSRLGSASVAYEHAVIETPFAFWQYGNPADPDHGCDRVPSAEATDDEVWEFAAAVNGISGYSDEAFTTFGSYYFQAGTQLGGPGARLDHLNGRQHEYSLGQYMPPGVRYQYSNAAMRDVERWVRTEATGIMFVYGELDPWTAAAYPQGENSDMHWYMAPGANHGAKFHLLADEDRSAALATLAIWFDRQPVVDETEAGAPTLDDLELAAKSQLRLP